MNKIIKAGVIGVSLALLSIGTAQAGTVPTARQAHVRICHYWPWWGGNLTEVRAGLPVWSSYIPYAAQPLRGDASKLRYQLRHHRPGATLTFRVIYNDCNPS